MKISLLALAVLALAPAAWGQQFVVAQPDCIVFFHFTAAGQTSPTSPNAGLDNRTLGCSTWNMSYTVSGFSAVSVALQSAANNAGAPGAYGNGLAVQQIVLQGTNPSTDTTGGFYWVVGFNAWVRVTLGSKTGTGVVDGALYGWRIPSASTSSTINPAVTAEAGGIASALADGSTNTPNLFSNLVGGNAVVGTMAGYGLRFNGSTWDREYGCVNQAAFNLSGSGDTQIIAASGSTVVRVCHISFTTATPEDFKVTQGTGSNCVTGNGDVTGLYKSVVGLAFDFSAASALRGGAGKALCLNQSVAQATGGVVIYAQY